MRIFEITHGSIDVRIDVATGRVCLVFESKEMDVKLFRTMDRDEALAFAKHLGARMKVVGDA